jgi:DNA-binding response OmpR family regulator
MGCGTEQSYGILVLIMATILIIDDDEKLLRLLTDYLSRNNYTVITAAHPDEGMKLLQHKNPDFIILDVMLPGMDGFEACRVIRKESNVPILMLTARGEVTDRIVGLELGADDYLPKPFEPRELLVRIKTILRRSVGGNNEKSPLEFEGLFIDREKRIVYLDGKESDLTSMEYNMLELFASKPGKTFSRDEILNHLQGMDADIYSRSIDIAVSRLRQKLGEARRTHRFIKTVWGAGYVFVGK